MAPFSLKGWRLIFVKSNAAEDPELLFKSIDDIAFRDPLSAESRKIRTALLLAGGVGVVYARRRAVIFELRRLSAR